MAFDGMAVRSRRQLLAASMGGVAALVATALGRPAPVRAGVDGDVVLGAVNTANETTALSNTTTGKTVLKVENSFAGSIGVHAYGHLRGLHAFGAEAILAEGEQYGLKATGAFAGVVGGANGNGHVGVHGHSDDGWGVKGESETAAAVFGKSDDGEGIYGESTTATGVAGVSSTGSGVTGSTGSQTAPGVIGWSAATGVFGASGGSSSLPATPPGKTGVFGYAAQDSAATGVHGRSTVGVGVRAQADTAGVALRVDGRAVFSRSGVVTIATGSSSYTKSLVGLTTGSHVFAVVRAGDGKAWVRKVRPNAGSFTVYLNKVAASSTTVTWIAFG